MSGQSTTFTWNPSTLSNQNWTSVSINSSGQNAVACMETTSTNFLYYNNNNIWSQSSITYQSNTNPASNQNYQVSISNNYSFVGYSNTDSSFCFMYSEDNGVNYSSVLYTGTVGGEAVSGSSINKEGIYLTAPLIGLYWIGSLTPVQQPNYIPSNISNPIILQVPPPGTRSFCALSDENYGFICFDNTLSQPVSPYFVYSSDIDNNTAISASATWYNQLNPFSSSTNFVGISCSSTGKYIIVGTNIGVFLSTTGNTFTPSNPPTFPTFISSSNVSGVAVSKSGQYGLYCENGGNIYYSNDYLQTWNICIDQSLSSLSLNWSSVSISDENNYNVYAVASVNGGNIYNATIQVGSPPAPAPAPAPSPAPSPAPNTNVIIKTIPNPIIAGQPAVITYQNNSYLPIPNNNYVLKNQLDVTISSVYTGTNDSTTFTFRNVYLIAGLNVLYIYNLTTSSMSPTFNENAIQIEVSSICFKEGTYILCYNKGNNDKYIPIEQLNESVYVKTNKHGYKKVKYLIKTKMINSSKKTINKLYVMKMTENNGLIEDLYVTGSHALLKDELSEKEEKQMDKLLSIFKDVNYDKMIDDKYKVLACFDKRFEEYNEEGYYNIYHIVLEDDKGVYKNYGIYANGILAESTMEDTLSKMNHYDLINIDNSNLIIEKSISIKDIFLKSNSKAKKYLNNRF